MGNLGAGPCKPGNTTGGSAVEPLGDAIIDPATLQALTTVEIKDCATTSFWNDVWFVDEALADKFLALYSYCNKER